MDKVRSPYLHGEADGVCQPQTVFGATRIIWRSGLQHLGISVRYVDAFCEHRGRR